MAVIQTRVVLISAALVRSDVMLLLCIYVADTCARDGFLNGGDWPIVKLDSNVIVVDC